MSRLKHTLKGFIRSLQISRINIFAFVEGRDLDPYFYGGICKQVCDSAGNTYSIRTSKEAPYNAGGKKSLIKFYRYLRRSKNLDTIFKGKRTVLVFFWIKMLMIFRKPNVDLPM